MIDRVLIGVRNEELVFVGCGAETKITIPNQIDSLRGWQCSSPLRLPNPSRQAIAQGHDAIGAIREIIAIHYQTINVLRALIVLLRRDAIG